MNKTSKCSAQWRSGSAFWKKGDYSTWRLWWWWTLTALAPPFTDHCPHKHHHRWSHFPPLFHKSFPADSKTMHCNVLLVKYHLVNKLKGFHLAGNFTTGKFFPLQNLDHNAFFFGLSWTALICYCLSLSAQKRGVWMHKILFRPTLVSPLSSRCWRTCGPVSLKIFVTKFNVKGALSMWGMLKFLDQDNFVLIWRQD